MRIWFALLVAPLLALVDQAVAYSTVNWSCAHQHALVVHGVHAVFLAATTFGTVAAFQSWRATVPAKAKDDTLARRHFLAGLATASAALSVLAIIAMWVPTWVLAPCLS